MWDTNWTQLTDANGNAVNANSLGGKTYATLFDASGKAVGLYRSESILQDSGMANGTPEEMYYDGFVQIIVNVIESGSATFSLENIPWHSLPACNGMVVVTIPVRKGQKIKVTSTGFSSASYHLFAPLSQ